MVRSTERDVHLTSFDTVMGLMTLASTPLGVVACSLPGGRVGPVRAWLAEHVPEAKVRRCWGRNGPAVRAVQDFLARRRADLDLPLDLRGTDFQVAIWRELAEVPYGETVGYGELAQRAGSPGASQACGTAMAVNPLPLFVPCHRVLPADGSLGGFAGGPRLKQKLMTLEQGAFALQG
jgi:O-6-methylguanine DNA methyltransferase